MQISPAFCFFPQWTLLQLYLQILWANVCLLVWAYGVCSGFRLLSQLYPPLECWRPHTIFTGSDPFHQQLSSQLSWVCPVPKTLHTDYPIQPSHRPQRGKPWHPTFRWGSTARESVKERGSLPSVCAGLQRLLASLAWMSWSTQAATCPLNSSSLSPADAPKLWKRCYDTHSVLWEMIKC